jgi:hypothetical protein
VEKVEFVEVKGVLDGMELKMVLDEVGMREEHSWWGAQEIH